MDFDDKQKLAVEISENNYVVNQVKKKKIRKNRLGLDLLDLAIIPVMLGVFVSLGFLIANLFSITSDLQAAREIVTEISRIF